MSVTDQGGAEVEDKNKCIPRKAYVPLHIFMALHKSTAVAFLMIYEIEGSSTYLS